MTPTRPTRLYLAGPMRGLPAFNFPAFDRAAALLRGAGFEVWSPAERDREIGFDPTGLTGHENLREIGFNLREALAEDLAQVARWADGVALLPGYRGSSGAMLEHDLAKALGLPVRMASAWALWGSPEHPAA